jgi:hypothetical protein
MPDPIGPGNSEGQNPGNVNDLMSALQKIGTSVRSVSGDVAAMSAALNFLHNELENKINPAIKDLGALPGPVSRQFKILEKDFKDAESVQKKFNELMATSSQRRSMMIEDSLKAELDLIRKHYQYRIDAAKNNASELSRIDKEQKSAEAKVKRSAWIEEHLGSGSVIGNIFKPLEALEGLTTALAGFASLGELLNLTVGAIQAQYKAGGAVSRVTGQDITLGGGQGAMTGMLGGWTSALIGVDKASQIVQEALAKAPELAQQNLEPAIGHLAHFGVTVEEAVKLITDASARAGISAKQFNENVGFAHNLIEKFGNATKKSAFDIVWLTQRMTDFSEALFQAGANTNTAQGQAQNLAGTLYVMRNNLHLTQQQMEPFAQSIASMFSSMSPTRALGILSMPGMGGLPNFSDPSFWTKVSGRISSPNFLPQFQRSVHALGMPAFAEPMTEASMLGINITNLRQMGMFQEFMRDLKPGMDMQKELKKKGLGTEVDYLQDIAKTSAANQGILETLKNILQFLVGTIGPAAEKVSDPLHVGDVVGKASEILHGGSMSKEDAGRMAARARKDPAYRAAWHQAMGQNR